MRRKAPDVRFSVEAALDALRRASSPSHLAGYARFALPTKGALGVPMKEIQSLARRIGEDDALAAALWESGVYEARLLASYVADPAALTVRRMDAWARDFDNWGVCDTVCFALFERSPHAEGRIRAWAKSRDEFVRRAGFALLACRALRDVTSDDAVYAAHLELIEAASDDARNFVKKSVSWALRSIGTRSPGLRDASMALAERLAASDDACARWIGKDALRDIRRDLVRDRAAARAARRDALLARKPRATSSSRPSRTRPPRPSPRKRPAE